jgi:ferrous-iron efflux pump FieF
MSHVHSPSGHTRLNLSAAFAAVLVALVLVALKAWALAETQSLSVAATLADSALNLMISAGGLAAIAYAARPADEDHRFGHSSAEDLAALAQALFLTGAALVLAVVSVQRLLASEPVRLKEEGTGIVVLAVSIVLTLCLILWQRHVAQKTGNRVVAADSLHYVGDMVPNLGAIMALWVSARYGISGIDSLFALIAAGMLFYGAYRIGGGAWHALMDRSADEALIAEIEQMIADYPGVLGFHDLRTRTSGSVLFIDFHIEVDGSQSLNEAHDISAGLKHSLRLRFEHADVLIHKDPYRHGMVRD